MQSGDRADGHEISYHDAVLNTFDFSSWTNIKTCVESVSISWMFFNQKVSTLTCYLSPVRNST